MDSLCYSIVVYCLPQLNNRQTGLIQTMDIQRRDDDLPL